MKPFTISLFAVLLLGVCHVSRATLASSKEKKTTYIVHMSKSEMPASFEHHTHWYDTSLKSVSDSAQMLYTYENAIHGFSTRLTLAEAKLLESQPGILSVLPELRYKLHTTRTPEFLGLDKSADSLPQSDSGGAMLPGNLLPLVYAGNASNATNGNLCMMGTLIPEQVAGKIVVCDRGVNPRVQKGAVVKAAGGFGMVLSNTNANGEELVADAHLLPATAVGQKSGDEIKDYLFSDPKPTVTILFEGTKVGIQPSPVVAAFSSRGPNSITPDILKPDLIAPGVNILAGWAGSVGPTGLATDGRRVEFNIISGTSMSCPHVSGLAALLKAAHPDWSPAAIRSALMTTAYVAYKNGKKLQDVATGKYSTPFDHGAGHVDPVAALNPGLVYDLTANDYLNFLCALNYSATEISSLARRDFTCDASKKYSVTDLNYPSFAVNFGSGGADGVIKHSRTLTNVGAPGTYKVLISLQSPGVKVAVEPETLSFSQANEKKSYTVTFTGSSMPANTNSFGRIEWSNGIQTVGSSIAVSWT
ncbi:PROPROTEIN CONVERTASE SUBTILISIN/KEXIN [Salix purpurea]|uniref:PROPROTEIN CONVERTASE SUBTILISIN/KEXIN n=1 Tax=Salix purpurea TaxID=77065 RepID=A0A9Q0US57_SALPP|nr:PROPROTEIN CONVERTASE SUBTILISIN/KEXIN [Salix purpurea]